MAKIKNFINYDVYLTKTKHWFLVALIFLNKHIKLFAEKCSNKYLNVSYENDPVLWNLFSLTAHLKNFQNFVANLNQN